MTSFFDKISATFSKQEPADPPQMCDIHCHILPGVDDGSKNWDMTLEMCRMARQDGVTKIVATPHASYDYAYSRDAHADLIAELQAKFPDIEFVLGCDFHCSYENVQDAVANPDRYVIGNTRYLLVEFNDYATIRQASDTISTVLSAGFRPIATHPERMAFASEDLSLIRGLVDAGAMIQLTANSLTGFWGPKIRKISEKMLKAGLVSIIASDAHDVKRRTPVISEAWRTATKLIGKQASDELVSGNPCSVLANHDLLAVR